MRAWLWSFEALARLCRYRDPDVKGWAADWVCRLYPEQAGPLMVGILRGGDQTVVAQAADFFSAHPDERVADALLDAFRKSSGVPAGRLTQALVQLKNDKLLGVVQEKHAAKHVDPLEFAGVLQNVARLGTDESRRYVESALERLDAFGDFKEMAAGPVFGANIAAGADMGKLLLFAYHSGVSGYVAALLAEIANRAGAWCTAEDLAAQDGKGRISKPLAEEVEESIALLAESGYGDVGKSLAAHLRKRRFDEVLHLTYKTALAIQQTKRSERGEQAFLRWQTGKEVPFFHFDCLAALEATAAEIPAMQRGTTAAIAIIVLACLAESRSLIAMIPEDLDPAAVLKIFSEDRPDAAQDDALIGLLAARADAKALAQEAVRLVGLSPFSRANGRLIRFAARFIDEGLAREMLALDLGVSDFEEDVAEALARLGACSVPLLRSFFEKNDPGRIPLALSVLKRFPAAASVDIILAYWSMLWNDYKDLLLDAVEAIGDRRFIPSLKAELKEGERDEAEIFRQLCLINGETDPELKRIEREIEQWNQRENRLWEAMEKGDTGAFLREPLDLPLQCRSCRSVYHYTVAEVLVTVDTGDTVIQDSIACKKCGTLDHYEITPEGMLTVSARLALTPGPESGEEYCDDRTVIPVRTTSALGKGIPLRELVAKYEKKLQKDPENPELLIGCGNALRQLKRREDSVPLYERVINSDPLAVEGYASLGEYAFDKGDLATAFSHYGKTADLMDRGHYYRLRMDRDQFKEAILDRLMLIGKRLGRTFPQPGGQGSKGLEPVPARQAVGRNHPCPCGSGKKYKKCCLLKESGQVSAPVEPERKPPTPDPVFHSLQRSLNRYVEKKEFRADFLRATAVYWNTEVREPIALPERASADQGQFRDWFLNDYRRANGKTILEDFLNRRPGTLSGAEKRLAESLLKSHLSIYEVQEVREGEGMTVRDVFTGETMDVEEVSGSYQAVRWDLLLVRVYRIDGVCRFGGNGQTIPRRRIEALKAYLETARRKFEADTGRAGWPVFLKENGFLIGRFFDEVGKESPVLLTEERHPLISARAHFTVSDHGRARKLLSGEYDFADAEEIPSGEVRFSWLKRGPSKEWEAAPAGNQEGGVIATSSIVHPSGQLTFTVLGTVTLHPDRLIIECLSRERLERGKKRLLDLLQGTVRHRIDEFQDIHAAREEHDGEKERGEEPLRDEESRALLTSLMQRHMTAWIDQAIPALGGRTPREAAATKAGRETVLKLIKDFENAEARKKKAGEPFIDIGPLRDELGIEREEG